MTSNKIQKKYTNYEEDLPASVYKLMMEERGKSVVLENTLSGGLCGVVTASGEVATDVTTNQQQMLAGWPQPPEEHYPPMYPPPAPALAKLSPLLPKWYLATGFLIEEGVR